MKKLDHHDFLCALACEFLHYKEEENVLSHDDDETNSGISSSTNTQKATEVCQSPQYKAIGVEKTNSDGKRARHYCRICMLEKKLRTMYELRDKAGEGSERSQTNMAFCKQLGIHAHLSIKPSNRLVFEISEFRGLNCMEIANHSKCKNLFSKSGERVSTIAKHPVMTQLREMYEERYPEGPKVTVEQLKEKRKVANQQRLAAKIGASSPSSAVIDTTSGST